MRVNCFLLLLLACHVTVTCSKRGTLGRDRKRKVSPERGGRGGWDDLLQMDVTADIKDVCQVERVCKSPDGDAPVPLSLEGPRGPPGNAGPSGPRGPRGRTGSPPVAFFVGYERVARWDHQSRDPDLIFDNIVTNVGNAYGKNTGHFTAPYDGAYQFTVVVTAQLNNVAEVSLVKKGHRVATIRAKSIPHWGSATSSVILSLVRGDQVWLKLHEEGPFLYRNMYTTFSGFALFASTDDN